MLYINFQLLKSKRRNSRTQDDVSDLPLPKKIIVCATDNLR